METNNVLLNKDTKQKVKNKKSLPSSQFELLNLAEIVVKKWADTPAITLLWVTQKDLQKLVDDFKIFLNQRVDVGSSRGSQTQTLKNLDIEINKAVEEIKIAILAKFGKEKGKAYFSEFGITKQNSSFKIPTDRNLRVNALPLLVKAIKNYNLQIIGFETTFFETLLTDYTTAFKIIQNTDSTVAVNVGNKNDLRKQIENVLIALNAVIRANYPNTYEGELRGWGFQKEKY
jgi:hypothetical protein